MSPLQQSPQLWSPAVTLEPRGWEGRLLCRPPAGHGDLLRRSLTWRVCVRGLAAVYYVAGAAHTGEDPVPAASRSALVSGCAVCEPSHRVRTRAPSLPNGRNEQGDGTRLRPGPRPAVRTASMGTASARLQPAPDTATPDSGPRTQQVPVRLRAPAPGTGGATQEPRHQAIHQRVTWEDSNLLEKCLRLRRKGIRSPPHHELPQERSLTGQRKCLHDTMSC